jgi:hypothetical protein
VVSLIALLLSAMALADNIPDLSNKPGVTRLGLTKTKVCSINWGLDEGHVTPSMKKQVFVNYGYSGYYYPQCIADAHGNNCEIDRLFNFELDNTVDVNRLWHKYYGCMFWNTRLSDRLKKRIDQQVCAELLPLSTDQFIVASEDLHLTENNPVNDARIKTNLIFETDMLKFITDENVMLTFRTYWPVVTILIALIVYSTKQRKIKKNIKDLLIWELFNNISHVYACYPKKTTDIDAVSNLNNVIDSARTLSKSSKLFSTTIYDKHISSLDVLTKKQKQTIFNAYNYLKYIEVYGKEITDLLKNEKRTKAESDRLAVNIDVFFKVTKSAIPFFEKSLTIFGCGKDAMDILHKYQGEGLENMRTSESLLKNVKKNITYQKDSCH